MFTRGTRVLLMLLDSHSEKIVRGRSVGRLVTRYSRRTGSLSTVYIATISISGPTTTGILCSRSNRRRRWFCCTRNLCLSYRRGRRHFLRRHSTIPTRGRRIRAGTNSRRAAASMRMRALPCGVVIMVMSVFAPASFHSLWTPVSVRAVLVVTIFSVRVPFLYQSPIWIRTVRNRSGDLHRILLHKRVSCSWHLTGAETGD